jgi:dephospho-CoA kinase
MAGKRIIIVGSPRCGKTTMAEMLGMDLCVEPRCTDSLIGEGWSEASAQVATWFDEPGPWIVEGVATARALRKWLKANPGAPADLILLMIEPVVEQTPGQAAMGKGVLTVWNDVVPTLRARGLTWTEMPAATRAA